MSGHDIAVGAVNTYGSVKLAVKPAWLIYLEDSVVGKKTSKNFFISLDKPDLSFQGMVHVRGIFSKNSEDEILSSYQELLTAAEKELYCEVLIPHHRVTHMRSLVFRQK